jgi:diguanylate cyclase (GGDEF)-like protein
MKQLFRTENGGWIGKLAPILIVGFVGVIASISVWYLTIAADDRTFASEFSGQANNQAIIFQSGIDNYWDKLYAVRALFNSSNQAVTREQFEKFANALLDPAILNIAWVPRVRRDERVAHELAAARDGLPDYRIRAIAPDGSLSVSPGQDEYFPKSYSTEAKTSSAYGLDLKDGGARERTFDHIRDADVLSTSPPLMLRLTFGEGDPHGFLAAVSVYAPGLPHDTVEDRRRNLLGFVQGVFQIGPMVDAKFANVKTPVNLYLFPPNAGIEALPIYSKSGLGTGPIQPRSQADLVEGLHRTFTIKFGDVSWNLVLVPEQAGFMSAGHQRSSIVLMSGLLLSGGFTLLVWTMRRDASRLRFANLRFDAALSNMAQGLLMFNGDGKLIISNRRFAELFGAPWEIWQTRALGMTVPQVMQLSRELTHVSENNEAQIASELRSILARRRTGTIVFERTDGHTFSAACAPTADGGFVVTFEDTTQRRCAEDKISHMAHHDALTDLPNRVRFYQKLEELFVRAPQTGSFAVFSLDLDEFKSVNDMLGHPIGDKLLQTVAERMRGCIRETDIVARLGGDEFSIVQVPFNQPSDATSLAERLIAAVSAPYQIDGHQVIVGTSIGIAIAPGDGMDPDQLMRNADLALYRCKSDGGSAYRFFETEMDTRMQERLALELDLRKALVNDEFTVSYQPIVNLRSGRITTCEALIRWHHPIRGCMLPMEFIPVAEETGLIVPIGEWVMRRACADAAEWPAEFAVAVNVSPAQFKSASFLRVVTDALEKTPLPACRLELEITELVLMQENDGALGLLHQLKDIGVSIAMDDFGTGYSSLSFLRSFPFDKIKIDRSFIRDLSWGEDGLAILRAVVGLGRGLSIATTAEGIETSNQLEIVTTEGCTEGQGYFFSQPRSAGEVRELLNSLIIGSALVA